MKLYVPLMDKTLSKQNDVEYAKWLKKCKADFVFIALERKPLVMDESLQTVYLVNITKHIEFFRKEGFGVGVWINTFGFGYPEKEVDSVLQGQPTITSINGKKCFAYCPEGEKFVSCCTRYIQNIAKTVAPDLIMLDDELCLSVRPGLGCFCEKHKKLYAKKFHRDYSLKELKKLIFTGETSEFRKGWIEIISDSMRRFCRTLRNALDQVAPNIRMGFCSGFTSWDIEGADAIELSMILAGNTKPFLRFSGAPYWTTATMQRFPGQRLNTVIEFTRQQKRLCDKYEIETFHECDSYPRPRYIIPANPCEAFDIALKASDSMSGLKYLFCYDTPPRQELGYVKKHIKNLPFVDFIEKHFSNKKCVGVQVFESMRKIENIDLGKKFQGELEIMTKTFSPAAHLLTSHSIPTVYEKNSEIAIVFGENAKYIDVLPKKLIVDIGAAEILQNRGFDLGLKHINSNIKAVNSEQFGSEMPFFGYHGGFAKVCKLKDNANIQSNFICETKKFPASYIYKSAGTEFLVFTFDGYLTPNVSRILLSYYRQKQLLDFIGKKYPYIEGYPSIYEVCKKDKNETAVFFLNLSEDDLFDFKIHLDKKYKSLRIFGAEGTLDGNKIKVTSNISAYGFFAVLLN